MNVRLHLAEIHMPSRRRWERIRELMDLTARALGTTAPPIEDRSVRRALEAYARFTRESADLAVRNGADLEHLGTRLREEAVGFGRSLAVAFGIRDRRQALRLLRLAYRAIGIDMRPGTDGAISVGRCFFKDFYVPETCRLIASLDEGLMAGICGEGKLVFTHRLTAGEPGCLARFILESPRP
jgi:hypothetical protein